MNNRILDETMVDTQINEMFRKMMNDKKDELGMTQKEIADKTLTSSSSISKYFNGKEIIPFGIVIRMCQVLNISIDEFYICFKEYFSKQSEKDMEDVKIDKQLIERYASLLSKKQLESTKSQKKKARKKVRK